MSESAVWVLVYAAAFIAGRYLLVPIAAQIRALTRAGRNREGTK